MSVDSPAVLHNAGCERLTVLLDETLDVFAAEPDQGAFPFTPCPEGDRRQFWFPAADMVVDPVPGEAADDLDVADRAFAATGDLSQLG